MSNRDISPPSEVGRRGFLGGLSTIAAAAAFSLDVPEQTAAQVTKGDDSDVQTVSSPDGSITVNVDVSGDAPAYGISYDGTEVITSSKLGFDFQNQETFGVGADGTTGTGISVTGSQQTSKTEAWTPVWDQFSQVSEDYTELRLGVQEDSGATRSGNLEFRVFDDGVGFRFVFDSAFGDSSDQFVISSENTQFKFGGDYDTWWINNHFTNPRFEQEYQQTKLSEVAAGTKTIRPNDNSVRKGAHSPMTMRVDSSTYLSVHEASLADYSTMSLAPASDSGGTDFVSQLAPLPDSTKVSASVPHRTPWRTIQMGSSPGDLVESSLVPLLNEPLDESAFPTDANGDADTSWVTPRKYVGIWWTMIAGNAKWEYRTDTEVENNTDPDITNDPAQYIHGARTERMKRYMRFASQNGIDSVLVEGWNQGWDTYPGDGTGLEMGVAKSYPDFDVPAVTDYGANLANPVEMTMHNETAGNVPNYEDEIQNDGIFQGYEDAGIHSIKNGYVSDPGLGFDGDGSTASHNQHCQVAVNHHRLVYGAAAGNRQMLEIHEGIKPTGERRTYPNVACREVVEAQEYDGFGSLGSSVGQNHHVTLPFTRMLAGPTSYQPGIFDITFNDSEGDQIQTTRAKQLAMYANYNTGLQMAADRVEAYVDSSFEVSEYVQAPSADLDGMVTGDDWRDAFGTHYVAVDPNKVPAGSSASFTVKNVPSKGTYTLHFRYASDDAENAQRVIDNGNPQFTLDVAGTTQTATPSFTEYWDDWQIHSVDVSLTSGDNSVTVALDYTTDADGNWSGGDVGGLNLNTVGVTPQGNAAPFPANYTDLTDSQVANENVDQDPDFKYIDDVPAGGWDETTVVDSQIGDYVITARRKAEEWYVGAMTGKGGRALDVPLDFLSTKTNGWTMELYTDGSKTTVDQNQTDVSYSQSIVGTGDTVLASMAASGGTALRLTPASSSEASNLPAYSKPTQSISGYSIEPKPDLDTQFISVTGSNSGDYIGGKTIAIEVDGAVETVQNVRLEPGASDIPVDLGYTITSPGSYTVVLRDPTTDTKLTEATVTVTPGELVADFSDPAGDDHGPGGYTYPNADAFEPGAFDLTRFKVYESDTNYYFSFEVDTLYDAFGGDFSPHFFVLWLRDPTKNGGTATENGDLSVTSEFASGWHYRVTANGWGGDVIDEDGNSVASPSRLINREGDTAILSVEKSALGDLDVFNAEVAPVVGSEDFGAFRDVTVDAGDYTFGGAKAGAEGNAPRILDMLTPAGVSQSDALAYDADTKAQIPFTPVYTEELGTDVDRVTQWSDPEGDDHGPGSYSYPSDGVFEDNVFDFADLTVYETENRYKFAFRIQGDLTNPWGSSFGFDLQQFHVFFHDPNATTTGSTKVPWGVVANRNNMQDSIFATEFHYRMFLSPGSTTAKIDRPNGDETDVTDVTSDVEVSTIGSQDAIIADVPKSAFESPVAELAVVPFMLGDDGGGVRWVETDAEQWRFGGGDSSDNHLNVIDTVVPETTTQSEVLAVQASNPDDYNVPFLAFSEKVSVTQALAGQGPVTRSHFETVKEAYEKGEAIPGSGGLVPDYGDLRDVASEVGQ